jgi:hypothetical protein
MACLSFSMQGNNGSVACVPLHKIWLMRVGEITIFFFKSMRSDFNNSLAL